MPIKVAWPALTGVSRFRARWTDAGTRVDLDLPGTATRFERPEATPGLRLGVLTRLGRRDRSW